MRVPTIRPKQLIKVLEKKNCFRKKQTGSHLIFYCPNQKKIISVPIHPKDLKRGLVQAIRKELNLSIEEFMKLLKDC